MVDSSDEEEDLELPPEIWRLVCDCLRPPQLGRLARTSRDVRKAVRSSPRFDNCYAATAYGRTYTNGAFLV